jgi:uncharacterized membrane protein YfcA
VTGEELVLASVIVAIGACLQGTVGFGMGIFCAPLLILVEPSLVPGPMLLFGTTLMVAILVKERASLDVRGAGWALVGRLPGSLVGAGLVALLSQSFLALFLAAVVLLGAAGTARGWIPDPSRKALVLAGATSGVMGTATSVGAPPMALVWQSSASAAMRASMSAFLLVGAVMSLVALAVFGELTLGSFELAVGLLPAIAVGFLLSLVASGRVNQRGVRLVAITVSIGGATAIIVQQLLTLW